MIPPDEVGSPNIIAEIATFAHIRSNHKPPQPKPIVRVEKREPGLGPVEVAWQSFLPGLVVFACLTAKTPTFQRRVSNVALSFNTSCMVLYSSEVRQGVIMTFRSYHLI